MLAESTPNTFYGLHRGNLRQLRILAFAMALIAVAMATAVTMRSQHRDFFRSQVFARILPFTLFSRDAAEAPQERAARPAPRVDPNEGRYRVLSEFVAKRYRVSQDVTLDWVKFAHEAGHTLSLDPLLIIAVIAIESRFNPIAESDVGAKGLMQVIPKYHTEKLEEFGGEHAVFDPRTNILVGSRILKEYLRRTGNLSIALQMYAGALNDGEDTYTVKVMNEKQRLQQAVNQAKRKLLIAQVSP
jgi:soluble lytic murein transglycosylase-like protein